MDRKIELSLAIIAATALIGIGSGNVGAVDIGCQETPEGVLEAASPPLGQANNWIPECIEVENGTTIQWLNADTNVHSVVLFGCYDSHNLAPGDEASVTLTWNASSQSLWAQESPDADPVECDPVDYGGEAVFTPTEQGVMVTYICGVHPNTMVGKIHILT